MSGRRRNLEHRAEVRRGDAMEVGGKTTESSRSVIYRA